MRYIYTTYDLFHGDTKQGVGEEWEFVTLTNYNNQEYMVFRKPVKAEI